MEEHLLQYTLPRSQWTWTLASWHVSTRATRAPQQKNLNSSLINPHEINQKTWKPNPNPLLEPESPLKSSSSLPLVNMDSLSFVHLQSAMLSLHFDLWIISIHHDQPRSLSQRSDQVHASSRLITCQPFSPITIFSRASGLGQRWLPWFAFNKMCILTISKWIDYGHLCNKRKVRSRGQIQFSTIKRVSWQISFIKKGILKRRELKCNKIPFC